LPQRAVLRLKIVDHLTPPKALPGAPSKSQAPTVRLSDAKLIWRSGPQFRDR
jgi:hypothetical protein